MKRDSLQENDLSMPEQKEKRTRAWTIAGEVMKEISRQNERADAFDRTSRVRKGQTAVQDVVFVLSMLSCLILTGLNVTGKMPFQTIVETPSGPELEQMTYQTLNFAVRAIDAWRGEHGRLPRSLTEVGAPADPRWTYKVIDADRYTVQFEATPFSLAYDSISDPDVFFASVRGRQ